MRGVEPIELVPIGVVASAEHQLARRDWSRARSEIRLQAGLGEALLGFAGYSHVIVVGWLDRVPAELRARRRAHPGGDERLPLQGALVLRGGARPNPLSVTVCRLLAVEGDALRVEGLDLVDGTPVLDVKPYIPHYDSVAGATIPGWAQG
ncbi:MAG: tRNA (N6-threonylcarbamoyladenosine(37)-N6)-methyltransferase TrmO [Dehalococcoidia bacterium]|nr:tRNA (N6-threonylcarbamoyladenosine(37)-N6)-methyltransferase TrmO [Dehalococcoidia bacterium]